MIILEVEVWRIYPVISLMISLLISLPYPAFLVVQGRWEHLNSCHGDQPCDKRLNSISFFFGIVAAMGCLVVATFQVIVDSDVIQGVPTFR